jgi:hypothetical protein
MSIGGPDVSIAIGCSKIITLAGFHSHQNGLHPVHFTVCNWFWCPIHPNTTWAHHLCKQPRRKSLMYLEGGSFCVIRLMNYSRGQIAWFCKIPRVKDTTRSDRWEGREWFRKALITSVVTQCKSLLLSGNYCVDELWLCPWCLRVLGSSLKFKFANLKGPFIFWYASSCSTIKIKTCIRVL